MVSLTIGPAVGSMSVEGQADPKDKQNYGRQNQIAHGTLDHSGSLAVGRRESSGLRNRGPGSKTLGTRSYF
jgi:hypothetical protein